MRINGSLWYAHSPASLRLPHPILRASASARVLDVDDTKEIPNRTTDGALDALQRCQTIGPPQRQPIGPFQPRGSHRGVALIGRLGRRAVLLVNPPQCRPNME